MAPTTTPIDPAVEDLAGVVWRVFEAADLAFQAAGPAGDLRLDLLSIAATDVAYTGVDLLGEHKQLCNRPASTETDPLRLILEAEQVLASRPIEQWPLGASRFVIEVCDLVRESRR